MQAWKFYFITFGCKVNQYETQSLREAWQARGGVECDDPAQADMVCVNSCAITARGERDARNAVFRLRRAAPAARLILTGCAARLFEDFRRHGHEDCVQPDLVLPQGDKRLLLAGPWTEEAQAPAGEAQAPSYPPFAISGFRRARPVLKVQDGCQHRCTYCIVPLTRGRCLSRPPEDVIAEARRLLLAGHAEIMISGINLRQYGRDNADFGDFWSLLRRLDAALAPEFAGRGRFRISSLEPSQLDDEGVETLMACRMLCPQLHISLQHASQPVLRRMGRGHYTAEMLQRAVERLHAHWPVMGLGADIIAGFPGEREEDVACLLDFVRETPFSYAHVFPYSRRPGTAADRFDGHLPQQVKQERAARVRAAVEERRQAFWQAQLALPHMLLAADSPAPDQVPARRRKAIKGVNEFYVPCILPAGAHPGRELLAVRPLSVTDKGLLVEPLAD